MSNPFCGLDPTWQPDFAQLDVVPAEANVENAGVATEQLTELVVLVEVLVAELPFKRIPVNSRFFSSSSELLLSQFTSVEITISIVR